jgi:replicative DNA helicase
LDTTTAPKDADTPMLHSCPVPWQAIHHIVSELYPGWSVVLGGRTSNGKTACGLQLAREAALAGRKSLVASLEMSADEVLARLLSIDSGFPIRTQTNMQLLNIETRDEVVASCKRLTGWPIWVDDTPAQGMEHVTMAARRLSLQVGLDLLVIDHLDQMKRPKAENETRAIDILCHWAKQLARELGIVVVLLHQIGRTPEVGKPKAPRISNLRGSSAIEQDADLVLLVHRPNLESNLSEDRAEATFIIGKFRHGRTGTVRMRFDEHRLAFE